MTPDGLDTDLPPLIIYSIGHSNHPLEKFLDLLARHGIETLVDVRSQPYSRYATHFNCHELEVEVERRRINYSFLGDELGGRPLGEAFYDAESHVLYSRLAEAAFFRTGLERLIEQGSNGCTAIMCSEEDPTDCHRRLLIARVLQGEGVEVRHLRANGDIQIEADLQVGLRAPAEQLSLFGELATDQEEDAAWRSIRPVSPRKAPPNSSNRSDESAYDDW